MFTEEMCTTISYLAKEVTCTVLVLFLDLLRKCVLVLVLFLGIYGTPQH